MGRRGARRPVHVNDAMTDGAAGYSCSMALPRRMTFGIFMAPFHEVGRNPTYALERDMQLIEWLDQLGFDEAWIGEHHSAGWGIIASPQMYPAAAAGRPPPLQPWTGRVNPPHHHPPIVA